MKRRNDQLGITFACLFVMRRKAVAVSDGAYHFRWSKPAASQAYEWRNDLQPVSATPHYPAGAPFLTLAPNAQAEVSYDPLAQVADLYVQFEQLANHREPEELRRAISDFAHKYGFLGVSVRVRTSGQSSSLMEHAESVWAWEDEIADMRSALEIEEALREDRSELLRPLIAWRGRQRVVFRRSFVRLHGPGPTLKSREIATERHRQDALKRFIYGDLREPARLALLDLVNEKLRDRVWLRLFLEDAHDRFVARTVPSNLLAGMWLQVYELLAGSRKIARCEICNQRMDVTESRSNKRMHRACANRNRVRRHREQNGGQPAREE